MTEEMARVARAIQKRLNDDWGVDALDGGLMIEDAEAAAEAAVSEIEAILRGK